MDTNLSAPGLQQGKAQEYGQLKQLSLASQQFAVLPAEKPMNLAFQQYSAPRPNNPFLSPSPSTSSFSSGTSSGRDEFHLERYSQDTAHSKINNILSKQTDQQTASTPNEGKKRRPRPGLNIVTDIPTLTNRFDNDDMVIEQVQAKRLNIARKVVKSVIASTEHATPIANQLEDVRHDVMGLKRSRKSQKRKGFQQVRSDKSSISTGTKSGRDSNKSIIIGMSIPQDEAHFHHRDISQGTERHKDAKTPTTPVIIVTPAEETAPWSTNSKRPRSSVYSYMTPYQQSNDIPPLPQIPTNLFYQGLPASNDVPEEYGILHKSPERIIHIKDQGNEHLSRRFSSESQEYILSSNQETSRRKSQGWWNLMLSPVMSRRGTIQATTSQQHQVIPPLPSVPKEYEQHGVNQKWSEDEQQLSDQRSKSFVSSRDSVCSDWTSWEEDMEDVVDSSKTKNQQTRSNLDTEDASEAQTARSIFDNSNTTTRGLADEYYHACAIEQLTGTAYFECLNHSCQQPLPKRHSFFEQRLSEKTTTAGDVQVSQQSKAAKHLAATDINTTATTVGAKGLNDIAANPIAGDEAEEAISSERGSTSHQGSVTSPGVIPSTSSRMPTRAGLTAPVVNAAIADQSVLSPGPLSPEAQKSMLSSGALPMTEVSQTSREMAPQPRIMPAQHPVNPQAPQPETGPLSFRTHVNHQEEQGSTVYYPSVVDHQPVIFHHYTNYRDFVPQAERSPPPSRKSKLIPIRNREVFIQKPNEDNSKSETREKTSLLQRLKCLRRKPTAEVSSKQKRKTRCWSIIIGMGLLSIVLTIMLLAMMLHRAGTGTPVQSQWLNLTGYPPIPTGISTIARPDPVFQQAQCVAPSSLWSCALPKESQNEVAPNNPDQPNFRFSITFENGTVPANMTIPVTSSKNELSKRDPFTQDLFNPNPSPPSRADQLFLGNTTDNITQPFDGEQTPFFITLIPVFPIDPSQIDNNSTSTKTRLETRQNTNLTAAIPAPDVLSDGSAAPANLLPTAPFPTSQPIKLYNRGLIDEHFGFYMYYDKSIFLHSGSVLNGSSTPTSDPEDADGGSTRNEASVRCTFSQTRFRVQMFTNHAFNAKLLGSAHISNNSASDFKPPGSFPYPTTITLDRHGGDKDKKAVYCYGMTDLQVIENDVKVAVGEDRSFGGQLINPAPALVQLPNQQTTFDPNAGGIDGGTGGCACVWQNWN